MLKEAREEMPVYERVGAISMLLVARFALPGSCREYARYQMALQDRMAL